MRFSRQPLRAVAVCIRGKSPPEFLLVMTRAGRWTFPGGRIKSGETPAEAAAREAREESGASGPVWPEPFAWLMLLKHPSELLRPSRLRAPAFILDVDHAGVPEERFRAPRWCSQHEAERLLRTGRLPFVAAGRVALLSRAMRRLSDPSARG